MFASGGQYWYGIAPIRLCPEITTDAKFVLRSPKTRLIKVWFWSPNDDLANGIYGPGG